MRIVTPAQRQALADAETELRAAVSEYDGLQEQITAARERMYAAIFDAEQAGMRQRDIVEITRKTREHIRRVTEKVAERVASESAEAPDPHAVAV